MCDFLTAISHKIIWDLSKKLPHKVLCAHQPPLYCFHAQRSRSELTDTRLIISVRLMNNVMPSLDHWSESWKVPLEHLRIDSDPA